MVRERNQEAKPDNANARWFLKIMDPLVSHHYKPLSPIISSSEKTSRIRNLNMGLWGIVQLGLYNKQFHLCFPSYLSL